MKRVLLAMGGSIVIAVAASVGRPSSIEAVVDRPLKASVESRPGLQLSHISASLEQPDQTLGDRNGDVYFTLFDGSHAGSISLVRLPGACVASGSKCPNPEVVSTPFDPSEMTRMDWSVEGRYAVAFIYQYSENPDRTSQQELVQVPPSEMFIFDAADDSWTQLLSFEGELAPGSLGTSWSEDGNWIAFAQGELPHGKISLYVVHPDGTGLSKVLDDATVWFGWSENRLIHQKVEYSGELRESQPIVSAIDPESGQEEVLFTGNRRAMIFPSPDGSLFAFADFHSMKDPRPDKQIRLLRPDGSEMSYLGSFTNFYASIWPVAWSPDSSRLAFSSFGKVYLTERGGQPSLVYKADDTLVHPAVYSLQFSPDGDSLLLEAYDGTVLMVTVSVTTHRAKIVSWPDSDNKLKNLQASHLSWQPRPGTGDMTSSR